RHWRGLAEVRATLSVVRGFKLTPRALPSSQQTLPGAPCGGQRYAEANERGDSHQRAFEGAFAVEADQLQAAKREEDPQRTPRLQSNEACNHHRAVKGLQQMRSPIQATAQAALGQAATTSRCRILAPNASACCRDSPGSALPARPGK